MKCHDIQFIIMALTLVFGTGEHYLLLFEREHNYTTKETVNLYHL